jgi:hypothetical protein
MSDFLKHKFTPTDGFLNESAYPNPETGEECREQHFSLHAQTRNFVNAHIDELAGDAPGGDGKGSGADKIGSAEVPGLEDPDAPGTPAKRVRAQIRALSAAISAAETALSGLIAAEAAARASEDAEIRADLGDEAISRAKADEGLSERIDAEAEARARGDGDLRDALDAEADARATADAGLREDTEAEAGTRAAGDAALQGSIAAEAGTRADADSALAATDAFLKERTDGLYDDLAMFSAQLSGGGTWWDILNRYSSWDELFDKNDSWLDVLKGGKDAADRGLEFDGGPF